MIEVNGKYLEWVPDISFKEVYEALGYTISNPRVIVRVNGENVPKPDRMNFKIPDSAVIEVINTLCGG